MRLPLSAHTGHPWRIHAIAPDFHVEDVWTLPTPGGPADFPRLLHQIEADDFPHGAPRPVRVLWEARWLLGRVFGWDDDQDGIGARVPSVRERLPEDLRDGPRGPELAAHPFDPLYLTENEWAAEIANRTVHGILHLGWVSDGRGGFRGQMAVLVKPNGRLGAAYMALIKPFRYAVVYPALLRRLERDWAASGITRP